MSLKFNPLTGQLELAGSTTGVGGGTGDMVKATYDPANIAQQLVGTTATQTITGKTLSGASNTFSNISADSTVDGTTNKVYTATEQTKLAGIATGAEVNVNADWTSGAGDSQILNKPATFTPSTHSHAISDTTGLQTALDNKLDDTQFSGLSKITVGTVAPGTPSVGDVWIDTN